MTGSILQADAELSLPVAMITSSHAPLLLLDGDLMVIVASASFCLAFDIEPTKVAGRKLFDLGHGEWNPPQLRSLLENTASGAVSIDAYEMDLPVAGRSRRLVLNARRLAYGDGVGVRLLVAVNDVTEARNAEQEKDAMLQERKVMLQEMQHRIANSLQIIASVLMQNARNVQSEETRLHLRDAHQRVMSVAALQQQLAASSPGDVELKPYFTQLCKSIGASMIHDREKLSIEVTGDASVTAADTSVCLGLIVTELVINALKHGFPDDRVGKITVSYNATGPNWVLRVADDGVGMPEYPMLAKGGLGTSIIEALAKQLKARVSVEAGDPGAVVSVIHQQLGAVDAERTLAAV